MERLAVQRLTEVMSTSPYVIATTAAAVSTAAVGGLFYAFSTFVMKGLDRTEPVEAITAMRGMNAEAQANAPFLMLFVGSALLALGVGIAAALRLSTPGAPYVLAGAALGLVAFVVTMAFNVPLNNRLDAVDPAVLSTAEAVRQWRDYLVPWTAWNHVRTVAPLVGSALILVGLAQR
ncbi:putative membrane protein [Mycolicibacterium sp. 624]